MNKKIGQQNRKKRFSLRLSLMLLPGCVTEEPTEDLEILTIAAKSLQPQFAIDEALKGTTL